MLAAGCSSSSRGSKASQTEQKIDELKVSAFANQGYDSGTFYAIEKTTQSLNTDLLPNLITLTRPKRQGKYPLVIYLPGLGESNKAAEKVRNAWAASGYVVVSIQLLKEDEDILSTAAAKEKDFSFIRHDRYSPEVVSNRLSMLEKLLTYLKHGVDAGDAKLSDIDLEHIAIIGFDIGANSAMIVAGEEFQSVSNVVLPLKISAVVAMSPYADFSGSTFDSRYRNINLPVLTITSDADDDTHGSVPISLHQAPFQYMPAGNKFLFLLAGASHAVVGNGVQANELMATESNSETSKKTDNQSAGKSSNRGRGKRNDKKSSAEESSSSAAPAKRPPAGPTQRAMMAVAIEQVSTAFLNAYLKSDPMAIQWLKQQSQSWLYSVGQLKEK
jgi:predicted dienelactone hydrolase